MTPMARSGAFLSLALAHASLSIYALLHAFSAGMARFDTGQAPSIFEKLTDAFVLVMFFPLVHLCQHAPKGWFSGLWGYLPILLNSALWAWVMIHAYDWLRARRA